jgi:ABC-type lipoprotein release transport system permease subunit
MGSLIRIGWRNLWRHKRRTLITASAMGVALGLCMALMCLTDGMYDMMEDLMVRQTLGHVQVQHPDYAARQQIYDTVPDAEATLSKLEALDESEGASGRLYAYGLAASEVTSVGARYAGIDPVRNQVVTDMTKRVVEGRFLGQEPAGEAVIGHEMAKELEIGLGDELVFLTQAADGSTANELLTVVGVFRTGLAEMDKGGAYLHLADMQRLLELPDQVHEILVIGADLEAVGLKDQVVGVLADGAEAKTWQEGNPQVATMLGMRDASSAVFFLIVMGVAALGILNTMLMSVLERTRELGVLRAVGLTRAKMMGLVVIESVQLAVVATIAGLGLGGVLDWLLVEYGINYATGDGQGMTWSGIVFDPRIKGSVQLDPIITIVVMLFFVTVVASLWPAWRAARLKPVDAMREA